jgi:hypothetical protein
MGLTEKRSASSTKAITTRLCQGHTATILIEGDVNNALTVCGPLNLVRDVAEGVHFLLGWGDQTGEFQLIVLARERADRNILF